MRVLVTGGSGYIGSRLITALAKRDDIEEIINVDIKPPPISVSKARYVERSVTESLRDLFETGPIDIAVHLVWVIDPLHDSARQRRICIGGTRSFLHGCAAADVGHILFMSSATAYGANPAHFRPVDESEPLKAEYHFQYSAEKREAEGMFADYVKAHPDTLLQVVRPCVVGGPNVSNFIFRAMARTPTLRPMFANPIIQLVHEEDCARAVAAILASKLPGAFNVAADGGFTLREGQRRAHILALPVPLRLMRALAEVAWRLRLGHLAEAPGGFVYFVAYPWLVSNRRLKEEVGFTFEYTAEETLEAYLASHQVGT